jgi:hypothetical protein
VYEYDALRPQRSVPCSSLYIVTSPYVVPLCNDYRFLLLRCACISPLTSNTSKRAALCFRFYYTTLMSPPNRNVSMQSGKTFVVFSSKEIVEKAMEIQRKFERNSKQKFPAFQGTQTTKFPRDSRRKLRNGAVDI